MAQHHQKVLEEEIYKDTYVKVSLHDDNINGLSIT